MRYLLIVYVLAVCVTSSAAAQPVPWPRYDSLGVPVETGLLRALNREATSWDALHYILRAGYRGGPANRATLRLVVTAYGRDQVPEAYASVALHSLWLLGEEPGYFLRLARQWDDGSGEARGRRKQVAYYAMMVLARDPTPEILDVLREISAASTDGSIESAYSTARYVAFNARRYEQASATAKLGMAIRWAARGWTRSVTDLFSTNQHLSAEAAVGQRWLGALSRERPSEVAQAIAALEFPADLDGEEDFRAYLTSFTSPEVRSILATGAGER